MKTITTLICLCISLTVFSQRMVEKEVGDFSELKVFDLIEVNLISSDESKVTVTGDNADEIKIINENGVLKIRMNVEARFDGNRTFVQVYYKDIDIIDANEGARITTTEVVKQNSIELRVQEGGRIITALDVNFAKIKAVTGGIIEVSGLAKEQEIKINTGGIFEGRSLETQGTKLTILAAGEAEINASEKADVKVTAGGDVMIYGNPKKLNKKRVAGGRIKVVD